MNTIQVIDIFAISNIDFMFPFGSSPLMNYILVAVDNVSKLVETMSRPTMKEKASPHS